MRKFISRFLDMKIQKKLLLSYIAVVFLPVLMVGLILIYDIGNKVRNSKMKEVEGSLDRIRKRITQEMANCITVSDMFYGDQQLHQTILKQYEDPFEVFMSYREYNKFEEYLHIYDGLSDIRVYVQNTTLLDNWHFMKLTNDIRETHWYKQAIESNGRVNWVYTRIPKNILDKNQYLTLTRAIKIEGVDLEAVLTICISNHSIRNIVVQEAFNTLIFDQDGIIIAARERSLLGSHIRETPLAKIITSKTNYCDVKYNGVPYRVFSYPFSVPKSNGIFTILVLVPVDDVTKEVIDAINAGILIMSSSLVIAFILILVFSKAFSSRISRISSSMHSVALGDFSLGMPISGRDEIGQLWEDLCAMVEGIKKLMEEIKTVNEQKHQLLVRQKDIKFKMLANQINPHFLFNALETIRMRAHLEGNKEVSLAIRRLGMIIRKSLEAGSKPIPLKDELELVRNYLELQKFKYGERIRFSINVEEERFNHYNILPFIIQPIVENAVIHGLRDRRGKGNIAVTVKTGEDNLIILVEDDGKGIDEDKIKSLKESFENYEEMDESSIGLRNVHQRIRLFYGPDYGVEIESKVNSYTKVAILLPKGVDDHV